MSTCNGLQGLSSGGPPSGSFGMKRSSEGNDNLPSPTPSDEGQYGSVKGETDVEDDPNNALIAQTLNADGTPKRPMNAFMIFARRRRPQVSAENQSMRTGEISKILSKEWNTMHAQDKQFYLDQAKQLKETFNYKYPDYVYRRRPNNSRRRRRNDPSLRPVDVAHAQDGGEDYAGNADPGEISPVEEDGHLDPNRDMHYSHAAADLPQAFANYNFPNESAFQRAGTPNARFSLTSNGERLNPSLAGLSAPRMPQPGHNLQSYPFLGSQDNNIYHGESMNSSGNWSGRGMWAASSPPLAGATPKPSTYHSGAQVSWASTSTSITHTFPVPPYTSGSFGTGYNQGSDSSTHGNSSPPYGSSSQSMRPFTNGRDYNTSPMAGSPPISPSGTYSDNKDYLMPYLPRANGGRSTSSNIQSISGYSQSQSLNGSTNSSPPASHSYQWPAEKVSNF